MSQGLFQIFLNFLGNQSMKRKDTEVLNMRQEHSGLLKTNDFLAIKESVE